MIAQATKSDPEWFIERRADGVLIVRIHSKRDCANPLPDAVFTFRVGDPQYDYWKRQAAMQDARAT